MRSSCAINYGITQIWEHGDIAKVKPNKARKSSQMIRQILSELLLAKLHRMRNTLWTNTVSYIHHSLYVDRLPGSSLNNCICHTSVSRLLCECRAFKFGVEALTLSLPTMNHQTQHSMAWGVIIIRGWYILQTQPPVECECFNFYCFSAFAVINLSLVANCFSI